MAHSATSHQSRTVLMAGWSTTAISPNTKRAGARPVKATRVAPL